MTVDLTFDNLLSLDCETRYTTVAIMVLKSWLDVPEDHDFSIENLPFGIFSTAADVSVDRAVYAAERTILLTRRRIDPVLGSLSGALSWTWGLWSTPRRSTCTARARFHTRL